MTSAAACVEAMLSTAHCPGLSCPFVLPFLEQHLPRVLLGSRPVPLLCGGDTLQHDSLRLPSARQAAASAASDKQAANDDDDEGDDDDKHGVPEGMVVAT